MHARGDGGRGPLIGGDDAQWKPAGQGFGRDHHVRQNLRLDDPGTLPPQAGRPVLLRAAAWLENGEIVSGEQGRAPNFNPQKREDPVLTTQQRIREVHQRYFTYSRAVSFANQGR